jgi:hypothetical protein
MTGLVDLERGRLLALVADRTRPPWTAGFRPGRATGWPRSARPRWTYARVRQRADRAARPCDRGGDHFHATRLANAVADQARRQLQLKQVTLGHRGRTYDPL